MQKTHALNTVNRNEKVRTVPFTYNVKHSCCGGFNKLECCNRTDQKLELFQCCTAYRSHTERVAFLKTFICCILCLKLPVFSYFCNYFIHQLASVQEQAQQIMMLSVAWVQENSIFTLRNKLKMLIETRLDLKINKLQQTLLL